MKAHLMRLTRDGKRATKEKRRPILSMSLLYKYMLLDKGHSFVSLTRVSVGALRSLRFLLPLTSYSQHHQTGRVSRAPFGGVVTAEHCPLLKWDYKDQHMLLQMIRV